MTETWMIKPKPFDVAFEAGQIVLDTGRVPTVLLTRAYGHTSEGQMLEYLCIQLEEEEIESLYLQVL